MFKIFADDSRGGVSYQVLYLEVNQNYDLKKMIPLIILGCLPILGIFGFAFAMAFVKANSTLPSSAVVERLFSAAGQILCSRRCKLSDDHFNNMVFLRDRLKS